MIRTRPVDDRSAAGHGDFDMPAPGNVPASPLAWLRPARAMAGRLPPDEWSRVGELHRILVTSLPQVPRDEWGVIADLGAVKRNLAGYGMEGLDVPVELGGRGAQPLTQALAQFVCGYHDVDLRDSAHTGHGQLIVQHGSEQQKADWIPAMLAGGLVGIAVTEATGGTNIRQLRTTVCRTSEGLRIRGRKRFISRIEEAVVFVVFARDGDAADFRDADTPNGHGPAGRAARVPMRAVVLPADTPGLVRTPLRPSGLAGWSWGQLDFDDVLLPHHAVLPGHDGKGDTAAIFHAHFDYYRPMVAMTALGGAAAVFDYVADRIHRRLVDGTIRRPRDSALEQLGRAHLAIQSAVLATLTSVAQHDPATPAAHAWAAGAKAHGVDTARTVVSELMPLAGAEVFQRDNHVGKTLRDLLGFTYADGVHDALRATAGQEFVRGAVR
ncbi:hypothetical protein GCM10010211_33010 [Streptomyces albospinus]|uniref:Acyl-CoA dehydrogenase n=1 Tax=Streptomyces albospinus TaxID=285515 RepID=A0ABQ2V234_9ACTN|nr:acyl-CoA dehydrogenase family protein [Streptomyces albospinus]GGU65293.1 hypothetical protein GCM10010211_33010 [Streptomyces albospinus]